MAFPQPLAEATEGRLQTDKGGWTVHGAGPELLARIQTRAEPPRLHLDCAEGSWSVRWDEKLQGFLARPDSDGYGALLKRSTFGADATLRRIPGDVEVVLDLRRVPRRRWHLAEATITRDDSDDEKVLLRFTGGADPLLLLLALWHAALAEGDDPDTRPVITPLKHHHQAPQSPGGSVAF